MSVYSDALRPEERNLYNLKKLYESYGYRQYKMSKFEEYDLYVRNKSFLVSDHIITFTDTDGKLMALKPDVTLSIVKNSRERENGVRKLYYNENVYRVPKGALSFKEIMQAGLECIGQVDDYCVSEVLTLAADSLALVSPDYVLDVSHMGILSSLIDSMKLSATEKAKLLTMVGEKNLHGIDLLCKAQNVDADATESLLRLVSLKGDPKELTEALQGTGCEEEAKALCNVLMTLKAMGKKVRVDFSVTDDTSYYSGIVFKGFIKGIPTSVLSGGQYDNLMKKMGKDASAIGFALYVDLLSELYDTPEKYDVDILLVYDGNTALAKVCQKTAELTEKGLRVTAKTYIPEKLTYKEVVDLRKEQA